MCHQLKICPNSKKEGDKSTKPTENRPRINVRVHAMTDFEVEGSNDVVTGLVLVNSTFAYVLFDCDATHSFVTRKFVNTVDVQPKWLDNLYHVSAPGDRVLVSYLKYNNFLVEIESRTLQANLFQINMSDFDIILGMD